jgi:hypothetical protein
MRSGIECLKRNRKNSHQQPLPGSLGKTSRAKLGAPPFKPLMRPHQLSYFRNIYGASNYGPNHFFPPPPPPPPSLTQNMPQHPFHQQDLFDAFMSHGTLPMPITNQIAPNQLCDAREGSTRVKNQVALAIWGPSLFASNNLF